LEVAARLRINPQIARSFLDRIGAKFFYCITRADANSVADWHARMQFDTGEDPATGSAAGGAIAYLVRHGLVASGQTIVIEQGIEILRASHIHVSATIENDVVKKVFVGGRTIPVASGRFFLP
jgi:trans-2,3-dihydro-3-hydroxyanthranilate isomerase